MNDILRYIILPMRRDMIYYGFIKKSEDQMNETLIVKKAIKNENKLGCVTEILDNHYMRNYPYMVKDECIWLDTDSLLKNLKEFMDPYERYREFFKSNKRKDIIQNEKYKLIKLSISNRYNLAYLTRSNRYNLAYLTNTFLHN